jgi:hypothetical protein
MALANGDTKRTRRCQSPNINDEWYVLHYTAQTSCLSIPPRVSSSPRIELKCLYIFLFGKTHFIFLVNSLYPAPKFLNLLPRTISIDPIYPLLKFISFISPHISGI